MTSGIPIGPGTVTARRLYRTAVGGGDLLLVAELADNVTTVYLDEVPDEGLGADAPALNTSGCPGTWTAQAIAIGDLAAGKPRAVTLGLNPGKAHYLQERNGAFADQIRELGSYHRWAEAERLRSYVLSN